MDGALQGQIFLTMSVFSRVAGLLLLLPVLGGRGLPLPARAFIALILTCVVVPVVWSKAADVPDGILDGVLILASEFLLGLAYSALLNLFFAALIMAGDLIGRMGGVAISTLFDPATGEELPVLSNFLLFAGLAVFVILGGFELFLTGFLDTFIDLPPGSVVYSPAYTETLLAMLKSATVLAIRLAAPVIVSTTVVYLALGIIGRTIPQLNVLSLSFSGMSFILFGVLCLGMGSILYVFQHEVETAVTTIFSL
ncbi:MAG: flagellar biosynthetic protein FliR [Planctomycetia bacterium]|nr:flagellar biosynthetic protein FliR [Planctomycetia bacterium]